MGVKVLTPSLLLVSSLEICTTIADPDKGPAAPAQHKILAVLEGRHADHGPNVLKRGSLGLK